GPRPESALLSWLPAAPARLLWWRWSFRGRGRHLALRRAALAPPADWQQRMSLNLPLHLPGVAVIAGPLADWLLLRSEGYESDEQQARPKMYEHTGEMEAKVREH